jgi:hypothetical protein
LADNPRETSSDTHPAIAIRMSAMLVGDHQISSGSMDIRRAGKWDGSNIDCNLTPM